MERPTNKWSPIRRRQNSVNRIEREAFISVTDALTVCRTIGVGHGAEDQVEIAEFAWMIDFTLDNYFSDSRLSREWFYNNAARLHQFTREVCDELIDLLTRDLLRRIQGTFQIVYPTRHYTYVWLTETGTIRITESSALTVAEFITASHEEHDDAYTPERLRRQAMASDHSD